MSQVLMSASLIAVMSRSNGLSPRISVAVRMRTWERIRLRCPGEMSTICRA